MAATIEATVARLLGTGCSEAAALGGGSLSTIWRLALADGTPVVVKQTAAARVEAMMLEALGAAAVPVPAVLAVDDELLVLQSLASDGGLSSAWASVGRVLGTLHGARGSRYGWPVDYAFGAVALDNSQASDWPVFWGVQRLAGPAAGLPAGLRRRIEALARELPNRLPQQPPIALLHGDLWGGNVLVSAGRVTGLIDPACYYGDPEVDLAMLSLFDAPTDEFFGAYGPRPPGHGERLPVYQLWPAIVHARLFGGGYLPLVERLLGRAGH